MSWLFIWRQGCWVAGRDRCWNCPSTGWPRPWISMWPTCGLSAVIGGLRRDRCLPSES